MKTTVAFFCSFLLFFVANGRAGAQAVVPQDIPPEILAYPDLILFNTRAQTMDAKSSTAQAVAVRGDRILAVGESARILRMAGPGTRKVDLAGKMMVPGFIDTHYHLGDYAMDAMLLEDKGIKWEGRIERLGIIWKDREMAARDIRRAVAAASPGELIGFPTREALPLFENMTLAELDALSPENPLILFGQGFRPLAVNSKAIQMAKLSPQAAGAPVENVLISGAAASRLEDFLTWAIPMEKVISWHERAMRTVNSWGLTMVVTRVRAEEFTALRELWLKRRLTVRWRVSFPGPLDVARTGNLTDIGDDWLRITGAPGGATPGSDEVLEHWSSKVPPKPEDVASWPLRRRQMLDALRHGWNIPNTHIKGDIAVREVLDVFEEAQRNPVVRGANQRLTMDHMIELDDADLLRIKRLGVMPSSQMIDLFCDEHTEGSSKYQKIFGADHVNRMLPIRKYLDLGIHPTVEADSGDEKHGSPLWGIEKLVCRCVDSADRVWGADQRISREDALRMKTIWAAEYAGDLEALGSIEAGKLADLVVLDGDYFAVADDKISDLKPLLTIVGGKVAYSRLSELPVQ